MSEIKQYAQYLTANGISAESAKTYGSYLTSVLTYCGRLPTSLDDMDDLSDELVFRVSTKTVKNFRSAMKHYIEMQHATGAR
jgi:hypothetical protein